MLSVILFYSNIATENNSHNYYRVSFTIYCSICTKLVVECVHTRWIPDLCCRLHYISRQRDHHLQKTFRLLALVGVKSLTLMPAIWLIQSAFRLVGWHFYPRDAMLARL